MIKMEEKMKVHILKQQMGSLEEMIVRLNRLELKLVYHQKHYQYMQMNNHAIEARLWNGKSVLKVCQVRDLFDEWKRVMIQQLDLIIQRIRNYRDQVEARRDEIMFRVVQLSTVISM